MGLGYKSDERKLEGFTNYIFNSKGFSSKYAKYDGQPCKIVSHLNENEYDVEATGTMWLIEFEDDVQTYAFADEIVVPTRKKEEPNFLKTITGILGKVLG
jgi:hypothetical protein